MPMSVTRKLSANLTFPVARLIYSVTFCDKVVSLSHLSHFDNCIKAVLNTFYLLIPSQARNQDFMWGGANETKVDQTTEMYFLSNSF